MDGRILGVKYKGQDLISLSNNSLKIGFFFKITFSTNDLILFGSYFLDQIVGFKFLESKWRNQIVPIKLFQSNISDQIVGIKFLGSNSLNQKIWISFLNQLFGSNAA